MVILFYAVTDRSENTEVVQHIANFLVDLPSKLVSFRIDKNRGLFVLGTITSGLSM
jgi:hypothetical protein